MGLSSFFAPSAKGIGVIRASTVPLLLVTPLEGGVVGPTRALTPVAAASSASSASLQVPSKVLAPVALECLQRRAGALGRCLGGFLLVLWAEFLNNKSNTLNRILCCTYHCTGLLSETFKHLVLWPEIPEGNGSGNLVAERLGSVTI